ncbi:Cytochrome b2, mitochondrial OS=Saccharomyces cerevisiae (strain ATCC 204508 / S288c) GN=CYB2 PE=1 SV=1 [Rhizoctonia solani AG-1 IB]|uniref:Cytochrome b2, mitochondrial n=1 Tax=Thanatephorus cucumeris (strain AG1-IB / isolate 7/3/14) TaxID=1108050 RepID=A0A0B7F5P5_THACB|nr:Cytochrome b2, mitochondrial OS=Saccharomyces cerevisiae (strain ATCC 204508 / S288c) GN=CYB2 PE=1 SV=1 [Rhizoctonia solani AG-1 IB]
MYFLRSTVALTLLTSLSLGAVIDTEGLPDTGLNTTSWVPGQAPPLADIFNLHDMQLAAKNTMSKSGYAYYRTGALDETTYHANLDVWKNIKLKARAFRNVANVSTETTILGHKVSQPFFITSAGWAGLSDPVNAELNFVRAAAKAGILYTSSIASNKTTVEIGAAAVNNQTLFRQLYPWSNATRLQNDLKEIEASGFKAIFLTVDNPTEDGIRTRARRQDAPDSSNTHMQNFDVRIYASTSTSTSTNLHSQLTTLSALQNQTSVTIIPKGISNWQDAALLHSLGFPACYISNHGGRLIDGQQTAAEILLDLRKNAPEVLDDGKMEIYADGGVRHGSDVIKLLALGARAVGLGRPPMFANIWGEDGVDKLISILATELSTEMKLIGVTSLAQINSTVVNAKILQDLLE